MEMKRADVRKEELLGLLTEIHDQLEELDQTLEQHFAKYRDDLSKEQSLMLTTLHHELSKLERDYNAQRFRGRQTDWQEAKFHNALNFKPSY